MKEELVCQASQSIGKVTSLQCKKQRDLVIVLNPYTLEENSLYGLFCGENFICNRCMDHLQLTTTEVMLIQGKDWMRF